MNKIYIGFHARSLEEFLKVTSVKGVNRVELKPENLARLGEGIYNFTGKDYVLDMHILNEIKKVLKKNDITASIHAPFEKFNNPKREEGLCQAKRAHHDLIINKFDMYGKLSTEHGVGGVITLHSPLFRYGKKQICTVEEAIIVGQELYARIDDMITSKGYDLKIGLENLMRPKPDGGCVGYIPKHLFNLAGDTKNFGYTIDTGHRLLNHEMSLAKIFDTEKVINAHFHSNEGVKTKTGWLDDQHFLATPQNLKNYHRFLQSFKKYNIPIILEIEDLDSLSNNTLNKYVINLRNQMDLIRT